METKYRVSWLSRGLWIHHDSKTLDEAISFAKDNRACVTQITEKEVWSYEKYLGDKQVKLDSLVKELGIDKVVETLEANLVKFEVEILSSITQEVLTTKSFKTKSEACSFYSRYNRDNSPLGLNYYGSATTYARIA